VVFDALGQERVKEIFAPKRRGISGCAATFGRLFGASKTTKRYVECSTWRFDFFQKNKNFGLATDARIFLAKRMSNSRCEVFEHLIFDKKLIIKVSLSNYHIF
jgi:hypothetical protein